MQRFPMLPLASSHSEAMVSPCSVSGLPHGPRPAGRPGWKRCATRSVSECNTMLSSHGAHLSSGGCPFHCLDGHALVRSTREVSHV